MHCHPERGRRGDRVEGSAVRRRRENRLLLRVSRRSSLALGL